MAGAVVGAAPHGRRGYASISEDEDAAGGAARRRGCSVGPRAWVAAVAAAATATAATAALLAGRGRHLRFFPEEASVVVLQEAGGKIELGVEYNVDGGWYSSMDHIPSAELCQVLCQGEPKCGVFTWVEDAGLEGCPSQCWLKSGPVKYTVSKAGVTSGEPPPRRSLPELEPPAGGQTLYCWALSSPTGDEPELLNWQAKVKASIFGCDESAIYSNQAVQIGGQTAKVIDSDMKCEYGGDSSSALNAWIFIAAWKAVFEDGVYAQYDWTVKADPDTVFFPNRLKAVLQNHLGEGYVSNCQYGLHGPLEVFSKVALASLAADYERSFDKKSPVSCVTGQDFGQWGEDMFIDQCLDKVLQVGTPKVDPLLICEDHCDCPEFFKCPASDSSRVSFHPFKTVGAYKNCMANALNGPIAPPGSDEDDDLLESGGEEDAVSATADDGDEDGSVTVAPSAASDTADLLEEPALPEAGPAPEGPAPQQPSLAVPASTTEPVDYSIAEAAMNR